MPGVSLPTNPFTASEKAAYNTCIYLERLIEWDQENIKTSKTPELCGRLLGYMMLEAPTQQGRLNVATEIQTCTSASDPQQRLADLAQFYENHYLRVFKVSKSPTLSPSYHPSRPSFNMTAQEIAQLLEEAPLNQQAAKKLCLIRDNFRCVVTGKYDATTFRQQLKADIDLPLSTLIAYTQLAHIIPSSMNVNVIEDSAKRDCVAAAWTVLDSFGKVDAVQDQSNRLAIHHLENAMTLSLDVRAHFDDLAIWFEDIPDQQSCYRLRSIHNRILPALSLGNNPVIELTTTDDMLPLPDPRLLRLHTACAKVAHLSGAGEHIDAALRDMEEMKVLASDGGSVDVLMTALFQAEADGSLSTRTFR